MSRLSGARVHGGFPSAPRRGEPYRRIALASAVVLAAVTGFVIGQDALSVRAAQAARPDLVRVCCASWRRSRGVLALGASPGSSAPVARG